MNKSILSTKNIILVGLMSAILCILAPISIPLIFTPIPITLGTFLIFIIAYILEPCLAGLSVFIYLLLGAVGLPVFSGYSGGIGKLLGPTGGFLIGFLAIAFISSYFIHKFPNNKVYHIISMVVSLAICLLFGSIWFTIQQKIDFIKALQLAVFPFLLGDGLKIILAFIVGPQIQKRINK